ncbi:hypothetical protein BJP36_40590 [Moorena producens JHB]|uniref:Uncharacterized protein n=1 Tax=Moorena producens (strain JHB) TaxID=1454205 RepID=A0A9Q9SS69_MOOP1|nr:hypothetical protein [Moorena producens]WAN68670.1 hypothetical protein BJP36_40590 [Moorena producens JHB]
MRRWLEYLLYSSDPRYSIRNKWGCDRIQAESLAPRSLKAGSSRAQRT